MAVTPMSRNYSRSGGGFQTGPMGQAGAGQGRPMSRSGGGFRTGPIGMPGQMPGVSGQGGGFQMGGGQRMPQRGPLPTQGGFLPTGGFQGGYPGAAGMGQTGGIRPAGPVGPPGQPGNIGELMAQMAGRGGGQSPMGGGQPPQSMSREAPSQSAPAAPGPYDPVSYAASQPGGPQGFPGVPGTSGATPTGYPEYNKRGPNGKKVKLTKWQKRGMQNLPPWMQDPTMFSEAQGGISEILGRKGQMSPERAIMEEADIESGRGQSMDAIRARLAQAGVSPDDPAYQEALSGVDRAGNRAQADSRRARDLAAEGQWRQDLQLPTPWLQAMLAMTGPKGAGGVTAAPVGGGGGGADWAGMLSSAGNSFLQGYGSSLGKA